MQAIGADVVISDKNLERWRLCLIKTDYKMFNSMNQQNYIARLLVICLLSLILIPFGHAHMSLDTDKTADKFADKVSKIEASDRLSQLNSVIDITITNEVQERIQQYTYLYRSSAEKILGRVGVYFPIFEKEIRRRGMPDDLKYLAIIESLLNPKATSRSGAAGLWQFMKPTGKMVGLEINSVVDQRRSVELSTQAALDYLQSLYDRFGDWNLVLAAYNCGPGNVNKAIKKSGSKDFWKMRKYLPRETQKYLPRFIAAMYLTNFYHHHGLQPNIVETDLTNVITVSVGEKINLNDLSTELRLTDKSLLTRLNPEYLAGYIPGKKEYSLRLPSRCIELYYQKYEPGTYSTIMEKREEAKRVLALKEKREKELKIASMKRDTLSKMETLVSIIMKPLKSNSSEKEYKIPRQIRSRESYAKL